ncbi:hypothetical protein FV139_16845 [Parahaliea maris]|uniref:OmpR/PhoB-type domain-containing protein n=1 Tax=Parahaliea maris TaxID=2716870 RepID=A0A5C8ZUA7_9GAMM|nr:winged helix-turn-helix domain-containing protein [Parahaliea maris]TXS91389.1 hypothetical protein FV139_16845 [Parahaliea maris]
MSLGSFFIGPYEVSPEQCVLRFQGQETKLTPRNMDVLVYMADHAERVVTSSELLERFWSPVASDHAVHKAISELRGALGDSVRSQQFIKTLPRRGYKLLQAPVGNDADATPPGWLAKLQQRLTAGLDYRKLATVVGTIVIMLGLLSLALNHRPTTSTPDIVTIGVESFSFQGESPNSTSFMREGLRTSLINQLARLRAVRVVALEPESEAAREEDVDHVLQGTLLQADGKLRAMVRLVRSEDGVHEYSERFELQQDSVFSVQDHIVSNIVTALSIHLDEEQRALMYDWGTTNAVAYERFMKGDFYYNQFNPRDFERAIQLYQDAAELDPHFINAHLGIAAAANNLSVFSQLEKQRELLKLVSEVHRNVASVAPDHEALEAIRAIEMRMAGSEYRRQEQVLRRQVLSGDAPSYALAHYALFLIGARLYEEAEGFLDAARETSPFELNPDESWDYRVTIARPEEAIRLRKDQLMLRPKHIGMLGPLVRDLFIEGRPQEAEWYLERMREEDTEGLNLDYTEQMLAVLSGALKPESPELESLYHRDQNYFFNNGAVAFALGDLDRGIDFWARLEPLQKRKALNMIHLSERYFPAAVIDSPRYQQLLEYLDLGLSWQRTLLEGVQAMEKVTGVGMSPAASAAYSQRRFVSRNTAWPQELAVAPRQLPADLLANTANGM